MLSQLFSVPLIRHHEQGGSLALQIYQCLKEQAVGS